MCYQNILRKNRIFSVRFTFYLDMHLNFSLCDVCGHCPNEGNEDENLREEMDNNAERKRRDTDNVSNDQTCVKITLRYNFEIHFLRTIR